MEINPTDIQNMTREYERALSSVNPSQSEVIERLIILEENQLDYFDCLSRSSRNGRTVNYLKNLNFRILNILAVKNGQPSYIPSVRTPEPCCSSPLSRAMNAQLDIFILLDRLDTPFADRAELISLENRKASLLAMLR